jgi:hypothetical protein
MSKKDKITWSSKKVPTSTILPTPNNYKIKSEMGKERFKMSLKLFGLAGNVVVNPDGKGKFTLVDGNSRWSEAVEAKEKYIWVSIPSRKLLPKEFTEMSALFDFAKAGDVDMDRIMGEIGTTEEFYSKWNIDVPMELLAKLGSKTNGGAEVKFPVKSGKGKASSNGGEAAVEAPDNVRMVNLFFNKADHEKFIKMEEKLAKRFKTDAITDTVFAAMKLLCK